VAEADADANYRSMADPAEALWRMGSVVTNDLLHPMRRSTHFRGAAWAIDVDNDLGVTPASAPSREKGGHDTRRRLADCGYRQRRAARSRACIPSSKTTNG
jgi:hypothetical protein